MSPPAIIDGDAPEALVLLRRVDFLKDVDDATLLELFAQAGLQKYEAGSTIVSELEPADVFIIVKGEAQISVDARDGERQILGKLDAGSGFGEMSSLTGELRSATVTALTDTEVLVITDEAFDRLRERRPQIAMVLVRVLSARIGQTEKAIEAIFAAKSEASPAEAKESVIEHATAAGAKVRRGSITRVWRELVVARRRDIAFLTLASFVLTLLAVRLSVYLAFRFDVAPRGVLRAAYMTGFGSLVGSACASLLTFRPAWRRAIAVFYGIGIALIFNELGVTLAFDIFYKDIHTPDPNVPFDIESLYERGAAVHAIAIGLVVLIQAAYLRRFYERVGFVLMTRARKLFSSG
jgi:CRP/FNR family transcriptional regulator, cyclic AMP receptor protein